MYNIYIFEINLFLQKNIFYLLFLITYSLFILVQITFKLYFIQCIKSFDPGRIYSYYIHKIQEMK